MSNEDVRHAIIEFCDYMEAGIKNLRLKIQAIPAEPPQALPKPQPSSQPAEPLMPEQMISAITWTDKEGIESHKPFKLAGALENGEKPAYHQLVKWLDAQDGKKKFLKDGRFLWLMQDNAIGMKMARGS